MKDEPATYTEVEGHGLSPDTEISAVADQLRFTILVRGGHNSFGITVAIK